jgi:hypothetical protein
VNKRPARSSKGSIYWLCHDRQYGIFKIPRGICDAPPPTLFAKRGARNNVWILEEDNLEKVQWKCIRDDHSTKSMVSALRRDVSCDGHRSYDSRSHKFSLL